MQKIAADLYAELGSGNAVAKRLKISSPTAYLLLKAAGINIPGKCDPKPRTRSKSNEEYALIVEDYKNGASLNEMTSKYKVSQWLIRSAVQRAGLPLRSVGGKKRALTKEQEDEVVRLYKEDVSQTIIASQLGCSQTLVSRTLLNRGYRSKSGSGKESPFWRGGISSRGGYILEWMPIDDKFAEMRPKNGYCAQHRLVVARHLDRPLEKHETVHHKNGDKSDNRIENLQLISGKHGKGVVHRCRCCGSTDIESSEIASEKVAADSEPSI